MLKIVNERPAAVVLQWADAGVEKFKKIPPLSEKLEVFNYFVSRKPAPVKLRIVDPATSKILSIGGMESFSYQPTINNPLERLVIPSAYKPSFIE